ncbi:MAG: formylglycine-generating enzyme family protein [Bacteroidales bacterium]|jgi:formylglycine-generating enzyme required for sulfatase activity|nr:formylglycine-generating enzyme family protein [Bacteroidales bacterium]
MKTVSQSLLFVSFMACCTFSTLSCQKETIQEKPSVETGAVSSITEHSATVAGNVSADGGSVLLARGICYNVVPYPTIEQPKIEEREGIGVENFSAALTGLTHNTTYYVRAYARNAVGLTYGEEIRFTTLRIYAAPEVTTADAEAANVEKTEATVGGSVLDDGGKPLTAVGVVYSETTDPTLETAAKVFASDNVTGDFSCTLSGLNEMTTYYFKAFASNDQGTTYGSQKSFTTKASVAIAPAVATPDVVFKAITAAMLPVQVTSTGGADIIRRGVCWTDALLDDPDASLETKVEDANNLTGVVTFRASGLTPNTTYRYRAYAENSVGIGYGEIKTFTTDEAGKSSELLILVQAGTFQMGADPSEYPDETSAPNMDNATGQGIQPKHSVSISKNYYIGKYEVSNIEFATFLNEIGATKGSSDAHAYAASGSYAGKKLLQNYTHNISNTGTWAPYADRDFYPCNGVTWIGATAYCEWLSAETGENYRLPTEAEWEYAARGGNQSQGYIFSGSDQWEDVGVIGGNNQNTIAVPGTKNPNELGIYDMTGNLFEFCSDYASLTYYSECQAQGTVTDPTGPASAVEPHATLGAFHVRRGNGYTLDFRWAAPVWSRFAKYSSSTTNTEEGAQASNGFRIVKETN